jgi:DUF1680 family protein
MLRLTRSLYGSDSQARYFDYFERALFNGILASQDPKSGMMTYFQATRPGYVKLFHTPTDSFWCCTGSGMENHARYGESIYAHEGDTLVVNLFIASTLDWKERGLRVVQSTRFPDSDTTKLTIQGAKASAFVLALRQPSWCPVMTVTFNGRARETYRRPGEYARISRKFRAGDVVEVRLPMSVRLERLPGATDHASKDLASKDLASKEWAALIYGPIVLAGVVGGEVDPSAQLIVNERESGNMLNADVMIPRWSRPLAELPAALTRTDRETLRFVGQGFEAGASVEFLPWYRIAHERYNLYWHRSPTPG